MTARHSLDQIVRGLDGVPPDHERIWLEPKGAPDRCWCQDNQWGDEGVEYVRADLFRDLEERLAKAAEALEPFAKYAGDTSHIKQRAFLQLLICPLGDEHPDNHVPYFQAARTALSQIRSQK